MYYDVIRITANNLYERISRIKYAAEKNFFPLTQGQKKDTHNEFYWHTGTR